jgi:NAD(P)-dependent dehydrogenase (short-subunit alcohol dehydrogenase family)
VKLAKPQAANFEDRNMPSILLTGANRGLGLEFTRQYRDAGWRVYACCRSPEKAAELRALAAASNGNVSIHALEVTNHAAIEALAKELRGVALDVLMNNAGIYGPKNAAFGSIDYRIWAEVFAVNVLAPMKMAECFVEHVARSERKIIACLSSQMGSVAQNNGGHYIYRSSKAALNMVVRGLAVDLKPRNVIAVVLHPGWVQTDMGGRNAPLQPPESIRGVRGVLDHLRPADSGKFLSYDGSELPW